MTGSWWRGTTLVARRALAEGLVSRGWRAVTAVMLAIGVAAIVLPRILSGGATSYTLATVGDAPPGLVAQLSAAGEAGQFTVEYTSLDDDAAVRQAVRDGSADVGLVTSTAAPQIFEQRAGTGSFPGVVAGAVQATTTLAALSAAGLDAAQIAAIQATPRPEQVVLGTVVDEGRAGVGFAAGLVLYLALILAGTGIATTVATEKSTRVSEVLLAVLRPTQLLVGTVLGVGLLALLQILALAVPLGLSLLLSDSSAVPAAAAPDVALAVVWFVLGLCLYAFVFAALAALVDKVTEVNSAVMPANFLLVGSYVLAVAVVSSSPESWVSVTASMFPLSAPLVMPARWATGTVPVWQLLLSMALTAAAAVVLAKVASEVYRRGVVRTGRRVTLRELIRGDRRATYRSDDSYRKQTSAAS